MVAKNKFLGILKSLLLLIVTTFICLLVAELMLRMTPIGSYNLKQRVLFYSQPAFLALDGQAVSYQPNTEIRSVAVYGDQIDYDTTKKTNNLGFYDQLDYHKTANGIKDIAFIGDSFTSSSGGNQPWVIGLRENIQRDDIQLYNFGVSATGLTHFHYLLKHLLNEDKVTLDEVNLMVISNDFFRYIWYPLSTEDGVRLCRGGEIEDTDCKKQPLTMHSIDIADNNQQILEKAQKIYDKNAELSSGDIPFYKKTRLFNLVCDVMGQAQGLDANIISMCPHLERLKKQTYQKNLLYRESIRAIIRMSQEFPNIKFRVFHIPEVSEVVNQKYSSLKLRQEMKHIGIDYVPLLNECEWDRSMYHKNDGHPNDTGYKNLASCLAKFIN